MQLLCQDNQLLQRISKGNYLCCIFKDLKYHYTTIYTTYNCPMAYSPIVSMKILRFWKSDKIRAKIFR